MTVSAVKKYIIPEMGINSWNRNGYVSRDAATDAQRRNEFLYN